MRNLVSFFSSSVKSNATKNKKKKQLPLKESVNIIDVDSLKKVLESLPAKAPTNYTNIDVDSLKKVVLESVPEKECTNFDVDSLKNIASSCPESLSKKAFRLQSSKKTAPADYSPTAVLGESVSEQDEQPTSSSKEVTSFDGILDISWFSKPCSTSSSQYRKELLRVRKQKWLHKDSPTRRFQKLIKICGERLGTESTLELFGKIGQETGFKEYNGLIQLCVESARNCSEQEEALHQIGKALQIMEWMTEQGLTIEEGAYSPLLLYFSESGMTDEFQYLSKLVMEENPKSHVKIAYYEMLLWIQVGETSKIQELCNSVDGSEENMKLAESYVLALCSSNRKSELLRLLKAVPLAKLSSFGNLETLFKCFGRLSLEDHLREYIMTFRAAGDRIAQLSSFICFFAVSMTDLEVEDIVLKFSELHRKLEVQPSLSSYQMLLKFCCNSSKVKAAFGVLDQVRFSGLPMSANILLPLLRACELSFDFDLVHQLYTVMHQLDLMPDPDVYDYMIRLCVRMKDFEGAYKMLADLEEMNISPTASMYNSIMAGYIREKNVWRAMMVFRQMKYANIEADSETFCYLLNSSQRVKDVDKYHEEMQSSGLPATKSYFMALIKAYVNCGEFEKAKQVISDEKIPVANVIEIKSVVMSAFASSGRMTDALKVYEEIKQEGFCPEAKCISSLIEHTRSYGKLSLLLQMLQDLNGKPSWFDGCGRVVLYCVQFKNLSCAIDLLKQLKEKDDCALRLVCDQIFSFVSDVDPPDVEFGFSLLQDMKEKVGLSPSRTSLDFLLSACVSAKDATHAQLIWLEYKKAGLPFNVLTSLRMYQALRASGESASAAKLLRSIPEDDDHVSLVLKETDNVFRKHMHS